MGKYKISKPKRKINIKLTVGFILWCAVCLFIYITAVRAFFAPITLIYIALAAICALIYVILRFLTLSAEVKGVTDGDKNKPATYRKAVKAVLFIGTPLLFSLLIDYLMIILGIYEKL